MTSRRERPAPEPPAPSPEWDAAVERLRAVGVDDPESYRAMFDEARIFAGSRTEERRTRQFHRKVTADLRERRRQNELAEQGARDLASIGITQSVLRDIRVERIRQQRDEGFAVEHDDEHTVEGWYDLVVRYLDMAGDAALLDTAEGRADYRRRMVQAAAVALAAIESFDRAMLAEERGRFEPSDDDEPESHEPIMIADSDGPRAVGFAARVDGASEVRPQ